MISKPFNEGGSLEKVLSKKSYNIEVT